MADVKNINRAVSDMSSEALFMDIYARCKPYTMTSMERMYALYKATEYVVKNNIAGDVVECGVWKGGSAMLSALTLMKMGGSDRHIYLYDTYSGMSAPSHKDISYAGERADERWAEFNRDGHNEWCYSSLEEVRENLFSSGYPQNNIRFIKGQVEETLLSATPGQIAILRLDTDWYDSTHCELVHLFPKLSAGGVLIVDDYGHWKGAKEAVDRYFEEFNVKMLLNRIDYTGRIGIKA